MKLKRRNNYQLRVNYHKLLFSTYFVLPLVFLDQAAKFIAFKYFIYTCNSYGVFGLATGGLPIYIGVLLLVSYSIFIEKRKYALLGLAFIFSGGLSNIIDRLFYGCVRDFIRILHFPTFNFADVLITIGLGLVIFSLFRNKNDKYSF